jgi:regulatory protein
MSKRPTNKSPKGPTPDYLERAAIAYLGRFSSSRANLRRVLLTKARRRARRAGLDWDDTLDGEMRAAIEDLSDKLERLDLVGDRRYAVSKVAALHARGRSERAIRAALAAKGVDRSIVDDALNAQFDDPASAERQAAIRYARRRRFGPYRAERDRADRQQKDLAAMARAGFAYGVAKDVIQADDATTLDDELDLGHRGMSTPESG